MARQSAASTCTALLRLGAALLLAGSTEPDPLIECDGYREEWDTCPGLQPCSMCQPVDCEFGDWGPWFSGGPCTQVAFRERPIRIINNECGKLCNGSRVESRRDASAACQPVTRDCVVADWSSWTACRGPADQKYRSRAVLQPPVNGGAPCPAEIGETQPCGSGPPPVPCKLSDWAGWTPCSVSCGMGQHTRMRTIASEASAGGTPCMNGTLEMRSCWEGQCPSRDCVISDWSTWSYCEPARHVQRYRSRSIVQSPSGAGAPCAETLLETAGCPAPPPTDCVIGEWSQWSACDRTCDGGQTFRTRYVRAPPVNGGTCAATDLRQTAACGRTPCSPPPQDCQLTEWTAWSSCSAKCGWGSRTRRREVRLPAANGGRGCADSLTQLVPCRDASCEVVNCQWSHWYDWSGCSQTCGGGSRERSRAVVTTARNGGSPCDPLVRGELGPCHTEPCPDPCVDAAWGDWSDWSSCSASCDGAVRSRRRVLVQEANQCGKPASGLDEEYVACAGLPPCVAPRDCRLSQWGAWSYCSATCFGVRERYRVVLVSAAGTGRPCDGDSLKEVASCTSTSDACEPPPPRDCELSQWSSWGSCSSSCGGGQMERSRSVAVTPSRGGTPCTGSLQATTPCATQPCEQAGQCQDCLWADWAPWSACSSCRGHRWRERSIARMPNFCGKGCGVLSTREMENCTTDVCPSDSFCAWTPWSDGGPCTAAAGPGTKVRTRTLALVKGSATDFLVYSSAELPCAGVQSEAVSCSSLRVGRPCVPQNGAFGAWSEWTRPTCDGTGLCQRARVVDLENNECGQPVAGAMLETKPCAVACGLVRPCLLSAWTEWTQCGSEIEQRYRSRMVEQMPVNEGKPCEGILNETASCSPPCPRVPCTLAPWREWSACSATCGGGWHSRQRQIAGEAQCGGTLCEAPLEEMTVCNVDDCLSGGGGQGAEDCVLGEWSAWSGCGLDGQQYRDRKVLQLALGGAPCDGALQETRTCAALAVDWETSDWSAWSACDSSCGFGQESRQRQILRFPENGGRPCEVSASAAGPELLAASALSETRGCNLAPCVIKDCAVSEWGVWGDCSATCGVAQQTRHRDVAQLRNDGGVGCSLPLGETRACPSLSPCPAIDGRWGDWSDWSGCTLTCGGGQMERSREAAVMPLNGGAPLEGINQEVGACNTQPCEATECEDGAWQDWEAWTPCSKSCGGGTTVRKRRVAKMATKCGQAPTGNDRETVFCNVDVPCQVELNCEMTDWDDWGDCSTTCNGVKHRSRRIRQYGRGTGAFCEGGVRQTWPCNTGPHDAPGCSGLPRIDCRLNDWSAWGTCSATCGGGERRRERRIVQLPQSGGLPCLGSLEEVEECSRHKCPGWEPVDCLLGDWADWAACYSCGGQRKRFREVLRYPANGGKTCPEYSAEEVSPCPLSCDADAKYCVWSDWQDWGGCSSSCGKGHRSRRQYLALSGSPPGLPAVFEQELVYKYAQAHERWRRLEAGRPMLLVAAFACGCLAFGVVQLLVKASTGIWQRRQRGDGPLISRVSSRTVSRRRGSGPAYVHLDVDDDASAAGWLE